MPSRYQNVSILNFTGAKDDGGGGDNWSYIGVQSSSQIVRHHQKVKKITRTLEIAPLRETPPQKCSETARVLKGSHSFTCTLTYTFIRNPNEPYLPSQLWLVLTFRSRRDERLRWPWKPTSSFLHAGCDSRRATDSVRALMEKPSSSDCILLSYNLAGQERPLVACVEAGD